MKRMCKLTCLNFFLYAYNSKYSNLTKSRDIQFISSKISITASILLSVRTGKQNIKKSDMKIWEYACIINLGY